MEPIPEIFKARMAIREVGGGQDQYGKKDEEVFNPVLVAKVNVHSLDKTLIQLRSREIMNQLDMQSSNLQTISKGP